ncbi:hypothetical protein [Photobacterium indicum]|uniref:Uncharacterized protein n=1 Tax=Photobacterium indicum TaxID=81447 RepID=A0A2T3LF42_9GAMM|nr:hypothetical protein [Photobacterium indicum]PSV49997.1 hypothetical protein C9J47_05465 [Photobacterium indicum]
MGQFRMALDKMAEGIKDLSSLDVVTYEGRVTLQSGESLDNVNFETVLQKAKDNPDIDLKIVASTHVEIDGDITTFYDEDISDEQKQAHIELIDIGAENRNATVEMIMGVIGDVSTI